MIKLPRKEIGSIPFVPSKPGLGCWALGGKDWGEQDSCESLRVLHTAFDQGITHFDTAQAYGSGLSEQLVGKALRVKRDKVFIASKASCRPASAIKKAVETSLKRMGTDYIDLYYIHWPLAGGDLRGCMEGLLCAKQEGKICGIGVSNFSVEQMEQVLSVGTLDACQLCFNLLWRKGEEEIIPRCIQRGISVVTYSTIAQGILSGRFGREVKFPAGDHRGSTVLFDKSIWPAVYEVVEQFNAVSGKVSRSLLDLAVLWASRKIFVSSVLVGARNEGQVMQYAGAFEKEIDMQTEEVLEKISREFQKIVPDEGNIFRYYP